MPKKYNQEFSPSFNPGIGFVVFYFSQEDGLHSNNVTEIEFDSEGGVWFGTRVAEKDSPDPEKRKGKGVVNRMINGEFTSFPDIEGFNTGDVYAIHTDNSGEMRFSTTDNGVYRYDGKSFTNIKVPIPVMAITDDSTGNVWLAGAGGLCRVDPNGAVINVTKNGPWPQ